MFKISYLFLILVYDVFASNFKLKYVPLLHLSNKYFTHESTWKSKFLPKNVLGLSFGQIFAVRWSCTICRIRVVLKIKKSINQQLLFYRKFAVEIKYLLTNDKN